MNRWMGIVLCVLCAGCGSDQLVGENYGNILTTDGGLVLTESEHPVGWGKSDCTLCHNLNNIHLEDLTGTGINVAAIRTTVYDQGLASCAACHGTNGVP